MTQASALLRREDSFSSGLQLRAALALKEPEVLGICKAADSNLSLSWKHNDHEPNILDCFQTTKQ